MTRSIQEILADIKDHHEKSGPRSMERYNASQELKNEFFIGKSLTEEIIELCWWLMEHVMDNRDYPYVDDRTIIGGIEKMGPDVFFTLISRYVKTKDVHSRTFFYFVYTSWNKTPEKTFSFLKSLYNDATETSLKFRYLELLAENSFLRLRFSKHTLKKLMELAEERNLYYVSESQLSELIEESETLPIWDRAMKGNSDHFDEVLPYVIELQSSSNERERTYFFRFRSKLHETIIHRIEEIIHLPPIQKWKKEQHPRWDGYYIALPNDLAQQTVFPMLQIFATGRVRWELFSTFNRSKSFLPTSELLYTRENFCDYDWILKQRRGHHSYDGYYEFNEEGKLLIHIEDKNYGDYDDEHGYDDEDEKQLPRLRFEGWVKKDSLDLRSMG